VESTFRILVADVKASALSSAASNVMAERKKIGEEFIDFFMVTIVTYFVCVPGKLNIVLSGLCSRQDGRC